MKYALWSSLIINVFLASFALRTYLRLQKEEQDGWCLATGQLEIGIVVKKHFPAATTQKLNEYFSEQERLQQPKKYCTNYLPFWAGFNGAAKE